VSTKKQPGRVIATLRLEANGDAFWDYDARHLFTIMPLADLLLRESWRRYCLMHERRPSALPPFPPKARRKAVAK